MSVFPIIYQRKGFPLISVFPDYLEVKHQNTGKVKQYLFTETKKVCVKSDESNFLYRISYSHQFLKALTKNENHDFRFQIISKKGTPWEYDLPKEPDSEFYTLMHAINDFIKLAQ